MRTFLFARTTSYWQYLITCTAVSVAMLMGGTGWAMIAAIGVIVAGAAIEAIVESLSDEQESRP